MGQLRKRVENQVAAEFNFPSDPEGADQSKIWPLPQRIVLDTLRSFIGNEKLRDAFGASLKEADAKLDAKNVAVILLETVPELVERLVVQSMREEDEDDAILALRELPFNDFVTVLAIMFSINFPGGVTGFLSLWERVTGLPLTSLFQQAIDQYRNAPQAAVETSTDESSPTIQEPATEPNKFWSEEDILSGKI